MYGCWTFDPGIGVRLAGGAAVGVADGNRRVQAVCGWRLDDPPPPVATATEGVTGTPPYAQLHCPPYRFVRMIGH